MPPRTRQASTERPAEQPAEQPQPATIAVARYDAGEGWEVGQRAPSDQYVEIGQDGAPVKDAKPTSKAPAGKYATQVAVKGDVVTQVMRRALGKD